MITYSKLENWWKEKDNKNKVVVVLGFIVMFFVGFGTGRFEQKFRRETLKTQTNYTTTQAKTPVVEAPKEGIVAGASTKDANGECLVKGNIASGGKKLYHVKGGAFYDRTKAEQCFKTEKEAIVAGYIKSSR